MRVGSPNTLESVCGRMDRWTDAGEPPGPADLPPPWAHGTPPGSRGPPGASGPGTIHGASSHPGPAPSPAGTHEPRSLLDSRSLALPTPPTGPASLGQVGSLCPTAHKRRPPEGVGSPGEGLQVGGWRPQEPSSAHPRKGAQGPGVPPGLQDTRPVARGPRPPPQRTVTWRRTGVPPGGERAQAESLGRRPFAIRVSRAARARYGKVCVSPTASGDKRFQEIHIPAHSRPPTGPGARGVGSGLYPLPPGGHSWADAHPPKPQRVPAAPAPHGSPPSRGSVGAALPWVLCSLSPGGAAGVEWPSPPRGHVTASAYGARGTHLRAAAGRDWPARSGTCVGRGEGLHVRRRGRPPPLSCALPCSQARPNSLQDRAGHLPARAQAESSPLCLGLTWREAGSASPSVSDAPRPEAAPGVIIHSPAASRPRERPPDITRKPCPGAGNRSRLLSSTAEQRGRSLRTRCFSCTPSRLCGDPGRQAALPAPASGRPVVPGL
ncbi:collagen alpha-1(I) chain-like [Choloepus didactylus]|uniref:collagen alpha-1(I) chain-like n=1 Tax=Choloepus didactylus TaxID=27675 RepID=UPI00189D41EB|nr:collagen alpha-1(I) chain-like [Choloepus didactylus]